MDVGGAGSFEGMVFGGRGFVAWGSRGGVAFLRRRSIMLVLFFSPSIGVITIGLAPLHGGRGGRGGRLCRCLVVGGCCGLRRGRAVVATGINQRGSWAEEEPVAALAFGGRFSQGLKRDVCGGR